MGHLKPTWWVMPINAIQLQPGLSMAKFIERYGTEAKCYLAVYRWRWPKGFRCPACHGRLLALPARPCDPLPVPKLPAPDRL